MFWALSNILLNLCNWQKKGNTLSFYANLGNSSLREVSNLAKSHPSKLEILKKLCLLTKPQVPRVGHADAEDWVGGFLKAGKGGKRASGQHTA